MQDDFEYITTGRWMVEEILHFSVTHNNIEEMVTAAIAI